MLVDVSITEQERLRLQPEPFVEMLNAAQRTQVASNDNVVFADDECQHLVMRDEIFNQRRVFRKYLLHVLHRNDADLLPLEWVDSGCGQKTIYSGSEVSIR